MICEICKDDGEKSKVFSRGGSSTLMGYTPYYDEEGILHNHNGNKRSHCFECSNGHYWCETSYGICMAKGCEWTGGKTEINYIKGNKNAKEKVT